MLKRRRSNLIISFKDRLDSFAKEMRQMASLLPAGVEKADLLRKARQADTAAHLDDWAKSPGLQPPR